MNDALNAAQERQRRIDAERAYADSAAKMAKLRRQLDDTHVLVRRLSDELRRAQAFIGIAHEGHRLWTQGEFDPTVKDGICRACDYFRNNKVRP